MEGIESKKKIKIKIKIKTIDRSIDRPSIDRSICRFRRRLIEISLPGKSNPIEESKNFGAQKRALGGRGGEERGERWRGNELLFWFVS